MKLLKNWALCLAAGLTAVCLPLPVSAAEPYTYEILEDGTAEITSTDTSLITAEIPAEIDGYTVTALSSECFSGHGSLQEVVFPETLTTIGDFAFQGCAALETITIPEGITKIGEFVFEGCTALTAITVDDANTVYCDDDGVLYTAGMETLMRYPAAKADVTYTVQERCTTIGPWAFTECSVLQTLDMSGVTAIGADAFFSAGSLQSVTLSEGLTELIGASFAYCANLQSVTLPSTLKTIGDKCFYFCVSLPSVTLPDGLTQIGEEAFYGCVQLKELQVPASVESIGEMGIGYSIDPDTSESALLSGFTLKTAVGSKALEYAKQNGITYYAEFTADAAAKLALWMGLAVLVLAIAGVIVYLVRDKRRQAERVREEQLAAEKREKRRARKARKANKK